MNTADSNIFICTARLKWFCIFMAAVQDLPDVREEKTSDNFSWHSLVT